VNSATDDRAFTPQDAAYAEDADASWPDDWGDAPPPADEATAFSAIPLQGPRASLQALPVRVQRSDAHDEREKFEEKITPALAASALKATESVAFKVREGGAERTPERPLPAPEPAPVAGDALGDFWHTLVQGLVAREAVTALVRELALQAQLIERQADQWTLRVESETLGQSGARDRLQNALREAGYAVQLAVQIGHVGDSPSRRNAIAAAQRMKAAEALVMADPFVQEMMRDFGARIVPGSIKPL
jgi:DNA polymerase-3 subunit gamma/tau